MLNSTFVLCCKNLCNASASRVSDRWTCTFQFALAAELRKQRHKFLVPEGHRRANAQAIHPSIISFADSTQWLFAFAGKTRIWRSFLEGSSLCLEQRHSFVHNVEIVHGSFFIIQTQCIHAFCLREWKRHVVWPNSLLGLEVDFCQVGHVQDILPLPHQRQHPLLQCDDLRYRLRGNGVFHRCSANLVEVLAQNSEQLAWGIFLQRLGKTGQLAKLALPTGTQKLS